MFALKVFIAAAVASTCNALALDNVKVLESREVKCDFGAPFNVTAITLDNGVAVQGWGCQMSPAELAAHHEPSEDDFKLGTYDTTGLSVPETSLTKRQFNACGISCTTYCYGGAGGGPDPNDCTALASGWTSGNFLVPQGGVWRWSTGSCEIRINNWHSGSLNYCWNDLRGVTNYIAWNCQAAQNAHGGFCWMNNALNVGEISVHACCE